MKKNNKKKTRVWFLVNFVLFEVVVAFVTGTDPENDDCVIYTQGFCKKKNCSLILNSMIYVFQFQLLAPFPMDLNWKTYIPEYIENGT